MSFFQIKKTLSVAGTYTADVASMLPVFGPVFNRKKTWIEALDSSARQLSGLSGGFLSMTANNLWGVNLMQAGLLERIIIMSVLMELGVKGGSLTYNTVKLAVNKLLLCDSDYKAQLSKGLFMSVPMEVSMLIGGVIGMIYGMKEPLFSMVDEQPENALRMAGSMEVPMLAGMTSAMMIEKVVQDIGSKVCELRLNASDDELQEINNFSATV